MGRCRCFPVALRKLIGLEPEDDDNVVERPEELINRYVRLMTATANITSGLGTLALLWSTVVLLGGFVAVLGMKDFWTLTLLSFLMASRYACTSHYVKYHFQGRLQCICRSGLPSRPYARVSKNHVFVGAVPRPPLQIDL